MTGGYKLLVPAALSVILAFLIQDLHSKKLKYKRFYEAQGKTIADSRTHLVGYLRIVVKLLSEKIHLKDRMWDISTLSH